VQFAERAVFAPGDAREDWTILRALADVLGVERWFDTFGRLREAMANMFRRCASRGWPISNGSPRGCAGQGGSIRLSDQGLST
jgi:NADH-quinone oxidoreductase subunit G